MKTVKKIGAVLLALCLTVPGFSMVASAADGRISFSDPETKVGDMVEVRCAARSSSETLGNVEITISYDEEYLSFDSGEGVEDSGDGMLKCTGSGGSTEQMFRIQFQALKEGDTRIDVEESTVASADGGELEFDTGSSAVKIGAGDPSKIKKSKKKNKNETATAEDMQVDVGGTAYTLTDSFPDGDIPSGYQRTQVELDGQQRQMVANETSGVTLGYLMSGDVGEFFVFNTENATFSPYAELSISDTTTIVLLSDTSEVVLPEEYKEAELTLNEKKFPVWQNPEESDFYVLYAMNSTGEKEYYRYDVAENTYQRFVPEATEEEKEDNGGLLGKVEDFINKYIQMIVLVGGLGGIVILLLIIILGVKLHNRNVELDELYEEYGIDEEEEEPKPKKKNSGSDKKKKKKKYDDDFDDDYEDDFTEEFPTEEIDLDDDRYDTDDMSYEEDEFQTEELSYGEEGFDTEDLSYDEDEFRTEELSYDEDEFQTEELDIGGDEPAPEKTERGRGDILDDVDTDEFVVYGGESRTEELTIDDLDELLSEKPKKAGHSEPDDTFKVDFIDLD